MFLRFDDNLLVQQHELLFFLSLNAFKTYNLLVQQHVLRRIWDVPQSWRWRRPRGRFLLIFFSFWDGIRTVTHSDYIFRLLECNQGCDLLEMILYLLCWCETDPYFTVRGISIFWDAFPLRLETQWMVKGLWQIESCPKWKLLFVFSVFSTSFNVYDAKNV